MLEYMIKNYYTGFQGFIVPREALKECELPILDKIGIPIYDPHYTP